MDDSARDVYRVRGVEVLDGRDKVLSYTDPAARTLATVIIQPVTGREDQNGSRDATLAQFSVIDQEHPAGWWRDADRLELDGVQYQIEGHVQDWPEPIPHTYFLINRWEG
jgi:hypothetical protein